MENQTFSLQKVNLLREQAIDAWAEQMPADLPEGWHISSLDLRPFIKVFSPLTFKPGLILRAYQFFYYRDGETEIWALPETAVFPPPDPDSDEEPPKPPEALDNIMAAIRGDSSPWSYLCASILARELTEVGTFGHASEWAAHHILDANLWDTAGQSQNSSPDQGPTGTAAIWQWQEPEPENWLPTVHSNGRQISVTFYTYCGPGYAGIHTPYRQLYGWFLHPLAASTNHRHRSRRLQVVMSH